MSVRTRFAPSPTGYLHVGGARTALYSWLFAKKMQGQFVLRIEDTDLERSTQASVDAIFEGMSWLGLQEDEGPFYQTKRFDRYHEVIEQLIADGHAYRCYCSKERLETLREQQMANKQKPRYDGCCRHLTAEQHQQRADQPYVIRFKNPEQGAVVFKDMIRGPIEVQNSELDDLIIARTDGSPTYNLTVVVDDYDMKISHVIRGDDHINNTPRQINILKAMGVEPPVYAHVPMILGDDGKRLSKRHGAVSVIQYKEEGFLPEALLNYLVRLGWSHGDQEVFSLQQMVELFDPQDVNKAPSSFNTDKLLWLNQHYMKTLAPEYVAAALQYQTQRLQIDTASGPALEDIVKAQAERCKTLVEMAEQSRFFYQPITEYDEKAAKKHFKAGAIPCLALVKQKLAEITDWNEQTIHHAIEATVTELEVGFGKVGLPLRIATTGGTASPDLGLTLRLIGQAETIARIQQGISYLEQKN